MVNRGPKSLSDVFEQPGGALTRLADEARRRSALADRVKAALPGELASQVLSCGLGEDGTVAVVTTSPEWASRLRFETMTILDAVRQTAANASQVRIKVNTIAAAGQAADSGAR